MKTLEKKETVFSREVITALFFTIGLIAVFLYLGTVRYEENDDMAITAMVKGLFGLTPRAEGVFISPFLGGLLFLLYKLLPAVSWFSLFLYSGVALACFLGSLTVLMAVRSLGGRVAGLLGVAFFICPTAFQISFAAVCLLFWVTGCVFLVHAVRRNLPQNVWFWLAASQLAAAYLLRPSLLLLLILLAVPLFVTLLLGGKRRVVWCALSPLIVVVALSLLSGFFLRGGEAFSAYQEFNKVRSEFSDTSRAFAGTQTPQALFAAKWSNEDYLVALNWWLHDGSFFNTEQVRTFLDINASKSASFTGENVKKAFSAYSIYFLLILFWVLVLLLINKPQQFKKIRSFDLLLYLFLLSVVFFLMGVRFAPRVAFPCFVMLFLNALMIFDDLHESNSWYGWKIAPPLLFTIFLTYSFAPIASQKVEEVEQRREVKKYIDQSLVGVLQKNGLDSIIVDVNPHILPANYFPFQENDAILKTRIMPGGWQVGSPAYLDFLQREGLGDRSTVVAAMIDNRRIIFRFCDSRLLSFEDYVKNIFLRHLRQRYTVSGSDRHIDLKVLKDDRQGGNGLVYFQLVTTPGKLAAPLH